MQIAYYSASLTSFVHNLCRRRNTSRAVRHASCRVPRRRYAEGATLLRRLVRGAACDGARCDVGKSVLVLALLECRVARNLHGWSLNTFLVSKHVSDPSSGWRLVPFRRWCHSAAFCTRNSARLKRVGNTVPPSEDLRCGWVAGRHPIAGARAARRRAEQPHVHRASATRSVESIPSLDSLSSDPPRFSDILPLRGGWGISDAKGSGRSSGVRGSTRLRSSHGARAEQAQPITRPARPRPLDVLLDPGIGS